MSLKIDSTSPERDELSSFRYESLYVRQKYIVIYFFVAIVDLKAKIFQILQGFFALYEIRQHYFGSYV